MKEAQCKELFDKPELADYLGVSDRTITRWKARKVLPSPIQSDEVRFVRWRKKDIDTWLEAQKK